MNPNLNVCRILKQINKLAGCSDKFSFLFKHNHSIMFFFMSES